MELADSSFDFDTSAKVKNYIIARESSPGPRNPSKKQMIWAEESRAEMVLGRIDQAVRCCQSFHTRQYGGPLYQNSVEVISEQKVRLYLYSVVTSVTNNKRAMKSK